MGQNITELALVCFGHHHAPESIFDVQFAEEDGFGVGVSCAEDIDEASKDGTELIHGVSGGGVGVGEFVDGSGCAAASLSLFGEV